jgi:hypothetical protein
LSFGVPIAAEMRSGEVNEYAFNALAGDLVSGTLEVHGLAVLVQVVDAGGAVVHTDYFFEDVKPVSRRIGFVAPSTEPIACRSRRSTVSMREAKLLLESPSP